MQVTSWKPAALLTNGDAEEEVVIRRGSRETILDQLERARRDGLAESTIARRLTALRMCLRHLIAEGRLSRPGAGKDGHVTAGRGPAKFSGGTTVKQQCRQIVGIGEIVESMG